MSILINDVKPNGFDTSPSTYVSPVSSPSMPTVPRRSVDPHSLVHMKLSKPALAVLGAEILDGHLSLVPTRGMVASELGVSSTYLDLARKLLPEARQEVARGNRPLVQRRAPSPVLSVEQRFAAIVAEIGGVTAALNVLAAIERR